MNGKKVDAAKLTQDMFVVKGYNTDAQSQLGSTVNYGLFGSEDKPKEIKVSKVEVNGTGNIVLTLETLNGVLNWSGDLSRNLTTYMRYNIAPVELPMVGTQTIDKKESSVKTGDDTSFVTDVAIVLLSAGLFVSIKKYVY